MPLVAGSSGILGSAFCQVLASRGERVVRLDLPWPDPDQVAARVLARWQAVRTATAGAPITLIWAAGMGAVSAPEAAMAAETRTIAAVADALAQRSDPDPRDTVVFASSAGALYGGHGSGLISAGTAPCPITAYGRHKVRQEQAITHLGERGQMRTVVCRFTNIYGLTSGQLRRKGLVAALIHSALLRQPARIFVNPDTRRDYLYAPDAAAQALAEARAAAPGTSAVATVSAGTTMTVLDLEASIARVLRRRVPVVFTESPETALQPLVMRFPARTGPQAAVPTTTFEAAVKQMAEAPLSPG